MSILKQHWNLFFQKENTNLSLIYQHSFQRKTEMVRKTCFSPFLQQIERDIHSHTGWHYWVVPQVLTDQWSAGWCVEHRKRRRSHLASVWRRWNTSNYCCVCWTLCTHVIYIQCIHHLCTFFKWWVLFNFLCAAHVLIQHTCSYLVHSWPWSKHCKVRYSECMMLCALMVESW